MIITQIKQIRTQKLIVTFELVDFCQGSIWLDELYTPTNDHDAGTTVQNPCQGKHSYKYYVHHNHEEHPSYLASYYAKKGYENPSKAAYNEAQKLLEHYIKASDCSLRCSIEKCGVQLAEVYGVVVEYSEVYFQDYEEFARSMIKDYPLSELLSDAVLEARSTLLNLTA
jgi:hypothetical protein